MLKFFQKLGKALMLPVAALPVCGILMGVVEAISLTIPVIAPYTDAIEFIILIIILLVRPNGILGKKRREKV